MPHTFMYGNTPQMRERPQGTKPTMQNIEGSPPQTRGRRPKGLLLSKHRRITPAYAGKNALNDFYNTV